MSYKTGYIGLGALGSNIAPNLAAYAQSNSLSPISVWNRSTDKYDALKPSFPEDTHFANDVEELVERCDVIFTCLVNDAADEEVYEKMVAALGKRKGTRKITFADQSTIKPATAARIEKLVKDAGGVYLSSPVFGQPPAAKAKQLVTVIAGDAEGREHVKPLLAAIGKKTIDCGDDVKKGASLKLLGNTILLSAIEVYGETYALSDAIGFDPAIFHELHQNLFAAPALMNYSNKISTGRFGAGAGFTVQNGLKDAGHILSLAADFDKKVSMPTVERAKQNLERARDMGAGNLDWSALSVPLRIDAGLAPYRPDTDEGKKAP